MIRFSLLAILLLSWTFAQTPFPLIKISDKNAPEEVTICINPKNPKVIVAAANINSLYISRNGGKKWTMREMTSKYGVYGDPVLVADPVSGYFYYFHLAWPFGNGDWLDRMVCQRSSDFGSTWSDGSYTGHTPPHDQDKQWAVVDPATGFIYLTWTEFDLYESKKDTDSTRILFSRSTDAGITWSDPVKISFKEGDCKDDDNTVEGAVPAIGPNGEVYVVWAAFGKLWFNTSADGGKTWLPREREVCNQAGGWTYDIPGIFRANGLPFTYCDLSSGPNRGRIYVNFSDQKSGAGDTDIWLVWSDDGGLTWSAPKRVNDDAAGKEQFLCSMNIDQSNGNLYGIYYDRRDATAMETHVYLWYSKDGGQTISNIRLTDTPFSPDPKIFFGDYIHISAWKGMVRPIWMRLDDKKLSIWTALVDARKLH